MKLAGRPAATPKAKMPPMDVPHIISKCFDTINHDLLLLILRHYGIHSNELQWFESYLTNRKQSVRCHGQQSEPIDLNIGIPQGGVLGPDLFLIFINDIVQSVSNGICNVFADDVIIYTMDSTLSIVENQLQKCINDINNWYNDNYLQINASKTNIMLISTRKSKTRGELKITLNGNDLKQVQSVIYLGVEVDCYLSWDNQYFFL